MKIMDSLKNKNVKKFLILSILTIILAIVILSIICIVMYNTEKAQILEKYNINGIAESFAFDELDKQLYTNIYISVAIILVIFILITIYFFTALSKNEKEIKDMRVYLQEIANRNYSFDLESISESEMSNLKEEIYKIVLELKEKSENLANDRETLSNYLADISHQLRTPLMAITAMTDAIIENEDNLDNDTRKFIYGISNQLNQINWLVNNLLKMAQLDTKSIALNLEQTNIKELFDNIKENLSIFLEEKNIEIVEHIDTNITINIDRKWMVEAIENILKNCIEYSLENSTIEIKCSQNPLYTEISIEDYGKGIAKEDLPKIFDKFYKGKNSSGNSFGIGLSLAKSIIERHNGEIAVKSEEKKGTQFIIKFPNVILKSL